MPIARHLLAAGFSVGSLASLAIVASAAGCGSTTNVGPDSGLIVGDGGGPSFNTSMDGGGDGSTQVPQCITGTTQCVNTTCPGGGTTTISGTVYDPAGNDPLYGIVVYVPSSPPAAITTGATCTPCNALYTGNPIAFAVTAADGTFTISGVPDGANIPLVVQVGKWRMQYSLPMVTACSNNDAPTLLGKKLKLPNNHTVGDIPAIGISTGAADSLECLLLRIGVDSAEYGPGASGPGRIHIFHSVNGGNPGANTTPAAPEAHLALWDTLADLMPYDITLLTCEGDETAYMNPMALFDYAQGGGRVFASHFHYAWFDNGPFAAANLATWTTSSEPYGTGAAANIDAVIQTTLPDGSMFPRGLAMQQWLKNVGALLPSGELELDAARHNALVAWPGNAASVPWIVGDTMANPPGQTEYFSFDTPFNSPPVEQCGRVVYSDLHVGAASNDYGGDVGGMVPTTAIVPTGCTMGPLSAQEKALEFMLFDLSGCVTPSNQGAGGISITPQ